MIRAEHVTKVIEIDKKKTTIVDNVSFNLEKGTITAIVGKSGCGKSTLLSMLCGIDKPSNGHVWLNGTDFYQMKDKEQERFRNEKIGIVFQNYHLIPELTCEENMRMPLVFSKKGLKEDNIEKMIASVGMEQKRKLFPRQLSGGEQQRCAIVRALVNQPSILYADEPTGALDSETGKKIIRFLVRCAHEKHITILLVTHDMDIAKQCDRVLTMKDGKIVNGI